MNQRQVNVFSADRYVITYRSNTSVTKIFQIAFSKDGSLFVTLPYYKNGFGRVGQITLAPNLPYPNKVTIGNNFPITSHYVKYSHHPSGRAHFSLTGKVKSDVGRNAAPLHQISGHIFTLMVQGYDRFEQLAATDKSTSKRSLIPFNLGDVDPDALKFVGYYYSKSELVKVVQSTNSTPSVKIRSSNGDESIGITLATPFSHNDEQYFLFLALWRIGKVQKSRDVYLSLTGGFDHANIAFTHSAETSFLFCLYPQDGDFQSLANQFGTIDAAV